MSLNKKRVINQKYFTSQISELPGPTKSVSRDLQQEYKEDNK
jgi:hypothetical protein